MKRIEAIAPLSRDHHEVLILAQLLKHNAPKYPTLPETKEGKITFALKEYNVKIKPHFDIEEQMMIKLKGTNKEIDDLINEIIIEHKLIENAFKLLEQKSNIETMNEIALLLQNHIRKEERIFFPLIQEKVSTKILDEIHELLH